MEVPVDMVEDMRAYMERLQFTSDVKERKEVVVEEDFEVGSIINHRIKDGEWEFQVTWKGYHGTRQWVRDEDCNCEKLISEYLAGKVIRTAYLFCRVSTKEQATNVNVSLEGQEAELRAAVTAMGLFTRIKVYSISQSAYRNIPRVLRDIGEAALPVDGIFVWRVDRLSRNIVKCFAFLEELNDRGVMIYSHQEQMTYSKKKMSFLQAVIDAQKEAALLGERIKLSYRRKRARGDEHVGGVKYGLKYHRILSDDRKSTVRKVIVENIEEKEIIERIRESKKNAKTLAEDLNLEGIKKRGRAWTKGMVRSLKSRYA